MIKYKRVFYENRDIYLNKKVKAFVKYMKLYKKVGI